MLNFYTCFIVYNKTFNVKKYKRSFKYIIHYCFTVKLNHYYFFDSLESLVCRSLNLLLKNHNLHFIGVSIYGKILPLNKFYTPLCLHIGYRASKFYKGNGVI